MRMVATASNGAVANTVEEGKGGQGAGPTVVMEELVALCKRRGFVFPSSEVCNKRWDFFIFYLLPITKQLHLHTVRTR